MTIRGENRRDNAISGKSLLAQRLDPVQALCRTGLTQMARIISHDEYGLYIERTVATDATRACLNRLSQQRLAEMAAGKTGPAGRSDSDTRAVRQPDSPLEFVLHARPRPTPNVITCRDGWLVNALIRKVIESYDRDCHAFLPVALRWMSGEPLQMRYWLLQIGRQIETVVGYHSRLGLQRDASGGVIRKVPEFDIPSLPNLYAEVSKPEQMTLPITLSRKAIGTANLWCEALLDLPFGNVCVSEPLFADLVQNNMYGLIQMARLNEI